MTWTHFLACASRNSRHNLHKIFYAFLCKMGRVWLTHYQDEVIMVMKIALMMARITGLGVCKISCCPFWRMWSSCSGDLASLTGLQVHQLTIYHVLPFWHFTPHSMLMSMWIQFIFSLAIFCFFLQSPTSWNFFDHRNAIVKEHNLRLWLEAGVLYDDGHAWQDSETIAVSMD